MIMTKFNRRIQSFASILICLGFFSLSTRHGAADVNLYSESGFPNWDAFDASGVALGLDVGTLGLGGGIALRLNDTINFRVRGSYLGVTYKETRYSSDNTFDYSRVGGQVLLDLMPGARKGFRLSTGFIIQDAYVDFTAAPRGQGVGPMRMRAEYDQLAPYVGIGFGNPVLADRFFSASLDIGVLFQSYSLDRGVTASLDPELVTYIEKRLDLLNIYPVITFSFSYHF
jgi:hypothetical protein